MARFDLIHEPWVPVVSHDGTETHVGLRDLLAEAHMYGEIRHASPLVTAALHRLALAILHRALRPPGAAAGPANATAWGEMWRGERFDAAALDAYFAEQADAFDLFHPTRPFYQTVGMGEEYARSITSITHEKNTEGPVLFDHTTSESDVALDPAAAARYLIGFHAYAIGGLLTFEKGQDRKVYGSADSGLIQKGAVAVTQGDNLFQTLMLNLVAYNLLDEAPFPMMEPDDTPAWERRELTRAADRLPRGYLDYLTWQSRRILLYPEETGAGVVVRRVTVMKGYQLPDPLDVFGREQMLGYAMNMKAKADEHPYYLLSFRQERAMWRDSTVLLGEAGLRPKTFAWLGSLVTAGELANDAQYRVSLSGLCSDRAKIFYWRQERLPLPLAYLNDAALRAILGRALALAGETAYALTTAARTFAGWYFVPQQSADAKAAQKQVSGRKDDVNALVESLAPGRRFWPLLDSAFAAYLVAQAEERNTARDAATDVDEPVPVGEALRDWHTAVRQAARRDLWAMFESLDGSARVLKARVMAEGVFGYWLHKAETDAGIEKEEAREHGT